MKPIKILYWTQLTFDNTVFTPVFFFKPNLELLTYINQNGFFNIPILISGTNDLYDGFGYVTMDIATMPGGCPNDFSDSTVIYSCTMKNTVFTTYPVEPFIGEFKLFDPLLDSEFPKEKPQEEEIKENFCGCFKKDKIEEFAQVDKKIQEEEKKPELKISEPTPTEITKSTNLTVPIIICVFLLIIIVLILCFYGDLQNKC